MAHGGAFLRHFCTRREGRKFLHRLSIGVENGIGTFLGIRAGIEDGRGQGRVRQVEQRHDVVSVGPLPAWRCV
jgi:hypothetical protein